jgi:hypothetical protein
LIRLNPDEEQRGFWFKLAGWSKRWSRTLALAKITTLIKGMLQYHSTGSSSSSSMAMPGISG